MIPGMGAAQDPVTGEVLPVDTTHTQLTPSTSSDTSKNVEDEEAKRRREAAEASSQLAQQARAVESLGVAPDVAAAAPPPAVSADPAAMPTGEGATGGIPTMATLPAQIDANASAQAAVQKQIADEKAALDARLATETKVRIETWNAEMEAAKRARADAKRPPEEKGFISDFFQAIAQGMGAYGATRGGGENHAAKILENQSKMEWEQHRARLDDAVKNLEILGKSREQIDGYADKERAKFVAAQQSRIDQMKAAADNMLKRFPDAQNKAFSAIAADQAKLDAEKQTIYKDIGVSVVKKGTSQEGDKLSSTTGRGMTGPKPPPQFDKTIAMHARVMDRAMTEFEARPELSPDALEIAQKNETLLNGAIEEAKTVGSAMKVNFLRDWKMVPKSATEGLSENDKIKLLNMEAINKSWLRVVSGAAIGKEEKEQNAQELTLRPGDKGEVLAWKLKEIKARTADMMTLSGDAGASAERANPQGNPLEPPPASPSPAKPSPKPAAPLRMDRLSKETQADLQAASKVMTDPKASPKAKAAAQKFTTDVAEGRIK
jgi:hypothetical protein